MKKHISTKSIMRSIPGDSGIMPFDYPCTTHLCSYNDWGICKGGLSVTEDIICKQGKEVSSKSVQIKTNNPERRINTWQQK